MTGWDGRDVEFLEYVRRVAAEYGLKTSDLKPCVAVVLDGNLGGAPRHSAAFTLAIELRRMGFTEDDARKVLERWARKIDYSNHRASRALTNAYRRTHLGTWHYPPPGLEKKPGGTYYEVLAATCKTVGCPQNCPPLLHVLRRKGAGGTLRRYEQLGWPEALRRARHVAADDVYRAVCALEGQRGLAPGGPVRTSYAQLAAQGHRDHSKIGKSLDFLREVGLVEFERGSGSGPNAHDRVGSLVRRVVPIPAPPEGGISRKSKHRSPPATHIGSDGTPEIGGRETPDIGGPSAAERR